MIRRAIDYPYILDLARLLMALEGGQPIPEAMRDAGRLTRYALHTRYPGLGEPVSEPEHQKAVSIAEAVGAEPAAARTGNLRRPAARPSVGE